MRSRLAAAAMAVTLAGGGLAISSAAPASASYNPCYRHPVERRGYTGSCVQAIQNYLSPLGAENDPDGYYGYWTQRAVTFMQGEYNINHYLLHISVDGVVGCDTYTFAFDGIFGSC